MNMNVFQHSTEDGLGNGGRNTALSAKALIVLDLVVAVVKNVKGAEEVK